MPAKRKINAGTGLIKTRQTRRTKKSAEDEVPRIYQEMLAEAKTSSPTRPEPNGRISKRRKLSVEIAQPSTPESVKDNEHQIYMSASPDAPTEKLQQVIFDDYDASEDGSDADFEDVTLGPDLMGKAQDDDHPEQKSLRLDLSTTAIQSAPKSVQRRKPVSKAERTLRLDIHKAHLLLLLLAIKRRNLWCNSHEVQAILKPLIPTKIINMLHVDESKPAFQRTYPFNEAIKEICVIWRREWEVTARGMRKAFWKEDSDYRKESENYEDPETYEEFKEAASTRNGSRDLGAQLFCALLRSAAVDARLVCSLQVLPFSSVAKGQTPKKPQQQFAFSSAWTGQEPSNYKVENVDPSNPRWRLSEHAGASSPAPKHRPVKKKIRDSPYPIFWVEVCLPVSNTWIPLDPLVRNTINKPKTGFEPPLSDDLNAMSYVIAFEEDESAKDITRRYTRYFNAKTRKMRVESTKDGTEWWNKVMNWFAVFKHDRDVRDDVEDIELDRRARSEAMPNNISDFKDHPVFALERHLKRNEAIWPKRQSGQIAAGNKDGKMESVFSRKDVYTVRSAAQWYRRGRDVKVGEQPLKKLAPTKRRDMAAGDEEEDPDDDGTLLYAEFQTEVYVPPPVVKGRIPKNAYGNLDVYVPSMIPAGAIHLQHPEAKNAARILGVDHTDAVTGFQFKGRQGTAVVNGIVVASVYREALVEVTEALEYEKVRAEEERRSLFVLGMWKRFMTALRIRARVDEDYAGDDEEQSDAEREIDDADEEDEDETYGEDNIDDEAGGFMPEADEQIGDAAVSGGMDTTAMGPLSLVPYHAVYHEVIVVESPHGLYPPAVPSVAQASNQQIGQPSQEAAVEGQDTAGGFVLEDGENPQDEAGGDDLFEDEEDTGGGGFLLEDDEEETEGGGFLPDMSNDTNDVSIRMHEADTTAQNAELDSSPAPASHVESFRKIGQAAHAGQSVAETPSTALPSRSKSVTPVLGSGESGENGRSNPAPAEEEPTTWERDNGEDAQSLLSHDPSDEDAEPEWLMDVDD